MNKFHPDSCIHKSLGFAFWAECSRHGKYYGQCNECEVEDLKDMMVQYDYLPYEKVQHLTEDDVYSDNEKFIEFVRAKMEKKDQ